MVGNYLLAVFQKGVAVLLCFRLELFLLQRIGNRPKNLNHRDFIIGVLVVAYFGVRLVINLVEFWRWLKRCNEMVAEAAKTFAQIPYEIVRRFLWRFSGHSFSSGEARGVPARQLRGTCRSQVYDIYLVSTY